MTLRLAAKAALLCSSLLLAAGCAPAATTRGMVILPADLKGPPSPSVASAIVVAKVTGKASGGFGEPYIDAEPFRQALEESLRLSGILSSDRDAPLSIEAVVLRLDTSMGFSMTARSLVRYTVRERRTGAVVIDEQFTAEHTATFSEAWFGETRARLSVEGSARKNIALLVQRLNTIQKSAPAQATSRAPST